MKLNKGLRVPFTWLLALLTAIFPVITAIASENQLSLPTEDLIAPEIVHVPASEPVEPGSSYIFTATVTDNVKIKEVDLFYRIIGESNYNRLKMKKSESNSDEYEITLDKNILEKPGIEYYIQAVDISGNSLLHGYSFSPLKIVVGSELSDPVNTQANVSAKSEETSYKWLWITLGVLAVGALASSGGGDDDNTSSKPGDGTATLIVDGPAPE